MATHRAKSRNSTAPTLVRFAASRRAHENDTTQLPPIPKSILIRREMEEQKRNSHEKSKAKGEEK